MAEAILRGILEAGLAEPEDVTASDPMPERREALAALGARVVAENAAAAADADVVLLAVKPQVLAAALSEIRPVLRRDQLVVSIAAGVPLAKIESLLPAPVPVVRVMPNVLASVRAGAAGIATGGEAGAEHVAVVREIFATVGAVHEAPEALLDAVTGLSGSGPAYVLLMIEALADGGVLSGLPRALALELATQTVLGTARLVQESSEHPAVWRDRVATPGGTTIAGLAELESSGVRGAFIRAVAAATRRARELSEKE